MTDEEFRQAIQTIVSCDLTNEAFDALEDIKREREILLMLLDTNDDDRLALAWEATCE